MRELKLLLGYIGKKFMGFTLSDEHCIEILKVGEQAVTRMANHTCARMFASSAPTLRAESVTHLVLTHAHSNARATLLGGGQ